MVPFWSAAVADFKPAHQSENKLKRGKDNLVVEFVPNPDIARKLGEMKSDIQFLVGLHSKPTTKN